jgi:hypothetical protein
MTKDDPLGSYDRLCEKIAAAQELQRVRGLRDFSMCYRIVLRERAETYDTRRN